MCENNELRFIVLASNRYQCRAVSKLEVRKNGIGRGLLFACLEDMRQQGYGYAIVGGVGPTAFYSKAVGAVVIEGSEPGVYRGLLRSSGSEF